MKCSRCQSEKHKASSCPKRPSILARKADPKLRAFKLLVRAVVAGGALFGCSSGQVAPAADAGDELAQVAQDAAGDELELDAQELDAGADVACVELDAGCGPSVCRDAAVWAHCGPHPSCYPLAAVACAAAQGAEVWCCP